jgi:hypothetical protein
MPRATEGNFLTVNGYERIDELSRKYLELAVVSQMKDGLQAIFTLKSRNWVI